MTLHRLFSRAALPFVLVVVGAGGCNLDLDDLLDDGMDTDAGDTGDDGTGDDAANDDANDGNADGNDDAADGNDDAADTTGGEPVGDLPAELVGPWEVGAEGIAIGFEFFDDASYVQLVYQEYDDEGCATVAQEVYAGLVELDGASMVLTAVEGYQSLDQCGTVSEGDAVADPAALTWSLGVDDLGDVLTLDDGTTTLVLHRSEEGSASEN